MNKKTIFIAIAIAIAGDIHAWHKYPQLEIHPFGEQKKFNLKKKLYIILLLAKVNNYLIRTLSPV